MKLKGSHVIAVLLAAGLIAWMATGEVVIGGTSEGHENEKSIADRNKESEAELFKVRYTVLQPEQRNEIIRVRGRTKADAIIPVRAETAGVLEKRYFDKGDKVKAGDLVCEVDSGARSSKLDEAEAALKQAQTEYESNSKLMEKGFASQNRLTQLQSQLNKAKSDVEQARLELSRVEIRANASGFVQDPIAEVGDVLSIGSSCITLIDIDPMYFIGQVSERNIDRIQKGMKVDLELVDGLTATGTLTYTAPSADSDTRTFGIEVKLDNAEGIRDGMTASANIELPSSEAFRLSPSWLVLADDGQVGITTLDEDNRAKFVPVKILTQTRDGFWVTGPTAGSRVVVLGQNFVKDGSLVDPQEVKPGELPMLKNKESRS